MKQIVLILIAIITTFKLQATHLSGAEITYQHVSGLTYKVKLRLYRDCSGANLGNSLYVKLFSTSQSVDTNVSLTLDTMYEKQNYCTGTLTRCSQMNNANLPIGFQVFEYSGLTTLPGNAPDWQFSYTICCRSNNVGNIVNAGSQQTSVICYLNNAITPFNHSVQYINSSTMIFNTGQSYTINPGYVDPDGDSLVFYFITPMSNIVGTFISNCTFAGSCSLANPFGFGNSVSLDSVSGNMTFQVNGVGNFCFAIRVDEYRNGILIASSTRDLLYLFSNPPYSNQLPQLSGINGTNQYIINTCANDFVNFTLYSSDQDVADSSFIVAQNLPNGATFTINQGQNQSGVFSWAPTAADVSPFPYIVSFHVRDNKCSIPGQQSVGYLVYVNYCSSDSVWPGDANNDFVVNMYDILNIGLGYNTSGAIRPNASTNWQAQYCPSWQNTFQNALNYKHADCDGNGIIDSTDLNVIALNYGQFHLKDNAFQPQKVASFPDLYFDLNGINPVKGTTIHLPIKLGNTIIPLSNIYGIAGSIELENAITSSPISLSMPQSWIGNSQNCLFFTKSTASNSLDFAITRKDQINSNGQGEIALLEFPIDFNSIPGSEVILRFKNLKIIDKENNEFNDYNNVGDTLRIAAPASSHSLSANGFSYYPNPVNKIFTVNHVHSSADVKFSWYTMLGQSLQISSVQSASNHQFDMSAIPAGLYLLRMEYEGQRSHITVIKE